MGYKQGELDVHAQLQSFALTGITEKQWDSLQDRSAAINRPLRKAFQQGYASKAKRREFSPHKSVA